MGKEWFRRLSIGIFTGIVFLSTTTCSPGQAPIPEKVFNKTEESPVSPALAILDPTEKWWLKPQTYHNGEGPDVDLTPYMNITVLHDWSSLFISSFDDPDEYWSYEEIQKRWDEAHRRGIRVEAVISIIDIWFVEFDSGHELYSSSAINFNGEHMSYVDPPSFIGCTNQHGWQEYLKEKIELAVDMGVDGIIIDDYEGSARWSSGVPVGMGGWYGSPGGCFCSACEEGFRQYLKQKYSIEELQGFGIDDIELFDYSEYLLDQGWNMERLGEESIRLSGWDPEVEISAPLYGDYIAFQYDEILEFLDDLQEYIRDYAKEKYNKEISWSVSMSEQNYNTHRYFSSFNRNVGGINYFGYPPKGTEGYYYRLDFNIFGAPRLREIPRNPIVVAVMNAFHTTNLWSIKGAEAYANNGALIEYDYFTIEGASDEIAEESLQNDPDVKNAYNTFYLDHPDVFDFTTNKSMAKVAVVYSSSSIKNDMFRHIYSFNGMCEILTDLHVQFDPIFIGDGIHSEDNLTLDLLKQYKAIILPQVSSLTKKQTEKLTEYLESGGNLIVSGNFAEMDENGNRFESDGFGSIKRKNQAVVGEGNYYHLWLDSFRADLFVDENLHGPATPYYLYYIENNHPAVEQFLLSEEEEVVDHLSEETAASIRREISQIIDKAIDTRIILDTFSENIGVQAYQKSLPPQKIFIHLVNYNYELETDTVFEQSEIPLAIELPEDFSVSSVSVISPDFEKPQDLLFTIEENFLKFLVPYLYIWDVILVE